MPNSPNINDPNLDEAEIADIVEFLNRFLKEEIKRMIGIDLDNIQFSDVLSMNLANLEIDQLLDPAYVQIKGYGRHVAETTKLGEGISYADAIYAGRLAVVKALIEYFDKHAGFGPIKGPIKRATIDRLLARYPEKFSKKIVNNTALLLRHAWYPSPYRTIDERAKAALEVLLKTSPMAIREELQEQQAALQQQQQSVQRESSAQASTEQQPQPSLQQEERIRWEQQRRAKLQEEIQREREEESRIKQGQVELKVQRQETPIPPATSSSQSAQSTPQYPIAEQAISSPKTTKKSAKSFLAKHLRNLTPAAITKKVFVPKINLDKFNKRFKKATATTEQESTLAQRLPPQQPAEQPTQAPSPPQAVLEASQQSLEATMQNQYDAEIADLKRVEALHSARLDELQKQVTLQQQQKTQQTAADKEHLEYLTLARERLKTINEELNKLEPKNVAGLISDTEKKLPEFTQKLIDIGIQINSIQYISKPANIATNPNPPTVASTSQQSKQADSYWQTFLRLGRKLITGLSNLLNTIREYLGLRAKPQPSSNAKELSTKSFTPAAAANLQQTRDLDRAVKKAENIRKSFDYLKLQG